MVPADEFPTASFVREHRCVVDAAVRLSKHAQVVRSLTLQAHVADVRIRGPENVGEANGNVGRGIGKVGDRDCSGAVREVSSIGNA